MGNVRVFFDHLFFSLIAIWVLLVIGYFGLVVAADDSLISDNLWFTAMAWVVSSLVLAGFFTYRSIKNRPSDAIVYTRRES